MKRTPFDTLGVDNPNEKQCSNSVPNSIGSHLDRLSENRYFGKFASHKFFRNNVCFFGFCILGQPVKV